MRNAAYRAVPSFSVSWCWLLGVGSGGGRGDGIGGTGGGRGVMVLVVWDCSSGKTFEKQFLGEEYLD